MRIRGVAPFMDVSFEDLAHIIQSNYADEHRGWEESPFLWLRKLSAKRKGAAMEDLVRRFFSMHGLSVHRSPGSQSDCLVGQSPCEIKGSTLWESGHYQFNQIRDQQYTHLILLGLSPKRAHLWCVPKNLGFRKARPQQGGMDGVETRFLKFQAVSPPEWLLPFGGHPKTAVDGFRSLLRKTGRHL